MVHRNLATLRLELDGNAVRIVIETPMRSPNKYDYDPESGGFELVDVLPRGSGFPFDFGFFPSTLGDDGDPLDALVLSDSGLERGTLVKGRVIGVIEFEDAKSGPPVRNDRLIAVPACSVVYEKIKTLRDLPSSLIEQIESFFEQDAFFKHKKRTLLGRGGAKKAWKLLEAGMTKFRAKSKSRNR